MSSSGGAFNNYSVAAPLKKHVKNWLHGENFKSVQDTKPEMHV